MNFLTRDYRTPTLYAIADSSLSLSKHCTYSGNRVDDGGAVVKFPIILVVRIIGVVSGSSGAYMECAFI